MSEMISYCNHTKEVPDGAIYKFAKEMGTFFEVFLPLTTKTTPVCFQWLNALESTTLVELTAAHNGAPSF